MFDIGHVARLGCHTDREATGMAISRRALLGTVVSTAGALTMAARRTDGQSVASPRGRVIVFDVNETLLDVDALAPLFRCR